MNFGYACLNQTLHKTIRTNRSTRDITNLNRISELSLKNIDDLLIILKWNLEHRINFFRISSDLFPRMDQYNFEQLPNFKFIESKLIAIGNFIKSNNIRVSFHPSQFNVLASPKTDVIERSIYELNQHGKIFDLMQLDRTPFYKINIHVGGAYGNKQDALNRFINNFQLLDDSVKTRLTVENDDRESMFTVQDLYNSIYKELNIPIVFDYLHYQCNMGNLNEKDSLQLAISTWKNIKPVVHISSSKKLFEDSKSTLRSHCGYLHDKFDFYNQDIDIMIEAKKKELALFNYLKLI